MKNRINATTQTKQLGAAIIAALFVVALVAAMTVMMATRLRIDIRRTELMVQSSSTYLYTQGSIAWAIDQLNTNWQQKKANQAVDRTPIHFPVNKVNGMSIQSTLYDAQGKFNVNDLMEPPFQALFISLLQKADPTMNAAKAQALMLAALNWISGEASNPELDEYYLKANPAYRAPRRLMAHASELRLVKGFDAALMQKLAPYVIALPKKTLININNASPTLLMSLSPTLSLSAARTLEKTARANPFASTQQFMNQPSIKNNPIDESKITVTSSYFLLKTSVKVGDQVVTIYSLLEREEQDRKANTTVLWQSKGTQ